MEECHYVNRLLATTCKGNSGLQTTPPQQHFPRHVPYRPPGNTNSWFKATQHQSTDTLILTNIFCIDNRSNYKETWGEVMEIDRFSKISAQPCLFLIFHIFCSMPLLQTCLVWVHTEEITVFFNYLYKKMWKSSITFVMI